MMGLWLLPPFWVIARDNCCEHSCSCLLVHVQWGFPCGSFLCPELLGLKEHCSFLWVALLWWRLTWQKCQIVFRGDCVQCPLPSAHCKWSCCSMASLSLDTIRVLNFCRSSGCKWCTFVVSIWAAISVFVGHLYFFCEMLFRSSSHFFLLGYLLYLFDLLELFMYSEDQLSVGYMHCIFS